MLTRLSYLWDALRGSFWFLPAVQTAGAIALSFLVVAVDRAAGEEGGKPLFGWTYRAGPDGARGVLSTIAGSMITVAGVVFSITMVVLSLASQQFGPRLIRAFTRDRGNQLVLGTFLATFTYCLLVLRTVNGTEKATFVPNLGVTLGVILALVSLAVLIYYIHHVAASIQASTVVQRVAAELGGVTDQLYPDKLGEAADEPAEEPADGVAVQADESGYVLAVDTDAVERAAAEHDLIVYLPVGPGRFVSRGDAVAVAAGPGGGLPDGVADALRGAVLLGGQRTGFQDIEFALLQLTEVAVRALSPGINDPFTAGECVDRLGDALGRLAGRAFPSPVRTGPDGKGRVVARRPTFPELLAAALGPIRHYARTDPLVLGRLLNALVTIDRRAGRPADRAAVREQAERVLRAAEALPEAADGKVFRQRWEQRAGGNAGCDVRAAP